MSGVFVLEPHNDDATLFSCFNAIRQRATIITVLRSFVQEQRGDGITAAMREFESIRAADELGLEHIQWTFRDDRPDWKAIQAQIERLDAERLYVPAMEDGGHPHHNELSVRALAANPRAVVSYLTYTREGKSKWGRQVGYETPWVKMKMRALACFDSQLSHPLQAEHFLRSWREYVA